MGTWELVRYENVGELEGKRGNVKGNVAWEVYKERTVRRHVASFWQICHDDMMR